MKSSMGSVSYCQMNSITIIVCILLLLQQQSRALQCPSRGMPSRSTRLYSSSNANNYNSQQHDIYAAVHRKEYEMKQVKQQHSSTTDPVRMAMGYAQETVSPMRVASAIRRVFDDKTKNPSHPNYKEPTPEEQKRTQQLEDIGMVDLGMRRPSFIVDIKRKSLSSPGVFCSFDDAGMVAEAMVRLGADAVFVNTDYTSYGGDMSELKSAVKAVRKISNTAAVVMKDIVVDEIQLGLAKEAGADGIVLMSSVLGPALENFLNLATIIGLETIVECHTKAEVEQAIAILAPTILVNNYDRIRQELHPKQAIQLAGLFPGSGGPIVCLAGGGIETVDQMKRHLAVGYDGVVVGKAVMGSPAAPEFIRAVRDRTLLPAEMSQWGIDAEFDVEGNVMPGPKRNVPGPTDRDVYQ
ncbi:hypothetical protein MPSEU_000947300 [Mayamaea pseudoterrestris]|nr:hypothetical protein MPSEU_000947300 [Mayamaea pseudoterrestris]